MGELAIFASGNGSNFQAIVESLSTTPHHVRCLLYDRKHAYVRERADLMKVPSHYVPYVNREREDAEAEINSILAECRVDLVALAGFMRILTPGFVNARKIVNIHPALLPAYPGANGLEESFRSGENRFGITIHYIDAGTDTGEIIRQVSIERKTRESLDGFENRIHELEHRHYPEVIVSILDKSDGRKGA